MGYIDHDPDEWKSVVTHTPCFSCGGDMGKCNGRCTGSSSYSLVRRSNEEIKQIKEARRKEHENAVIRAAEAILGRKLR